jgi:hypothetical protein
MEQRSHGSNAQPRQPHGVVCLAIEDVQTTPAIHQDLSEACLADYGVHDEREMVRLWDVVRVVSPVECDCRLQPLEVGRDSLARRKAFTSQAASLCWRLDS